MVISKKKEAPTCNLKVKDKIIKQVSAFNYLGSTVTEDSRCVSEVKRRITLAKSAFSKLENILRNRTLGMETRLRVLHCYIHPVLLYGSEAWTITSHLRKRLESCEMWFLSPGGGGGGSTSILKVTGTCRWTGYNFAIINISTGYLVALLRSSILAQGI